MDPKQLVEGLLEPSNRENSLAELSKYREINPDLALSLWQTPGIRPP